MPDRTAYNKCMKPWMSGGGEDRRLRFCIGAKICSGRTNNEEEARRICLTEPKKEPSTGKKRGSCNTNMAELATCTIAKIDLDMVTPENFEKVLSEALQECSCGKIKKPKKPSRMQSVMKKMTPEHLEALEAIAMVSEAYAENRPAPPAHWGSKW